jgi:hypothetical protein
VGRAASAPDPRAAAERLEQAPRLPPGVGERFTGWGVLGIGFASGHLLALRRMTASSIGPAFTSVWHRDPRGRWTFYADVDPDLACARYFLGAGADAGHRGVAGTAVRDDILVRWHGPTSFSVRVPGPRLAWAVHLGPTPGIRALESLAAGLPAALRRRQSVRRLLALAAARVLRLGGLAVTGRTPAGGAFELVPRRFWLVDASSARLGGAHLGPPIVLRRQHELGDFRIPAWGVFTTGEAVFHPGPAVQEPGSMSDPSALPPLLPEPGRSEPYPA